MKLLAVFATVTALMVAPAACAGDVEVHGNVYLHYRSVLSSESWKGYNAFDISRAHLTFTGPLSRMEKVGRRMRFDITTDLTRLSELGQSGTQSVAGSAVVIPEAEANGYLMRFIKHAYLEIEGVRPGLSVRFGQSPAPWVPYEEQIWGFRWIERSFGNLEGKLSEAELGFSALYSFPRGFGDLHAAVVNGEGFHRSDPNKYKDVLTRISFHPFVMSNILASVKLHLYYGYGIQDKDVARNRGVVALSWDLFVMQILGEYLFTEDGPSGSREHGRGYSFFLHMDSCKIKAIANQDRRRLGSSCGSFFRYERFDPDSNLDNDAHTRMIVGYQRLLERGVAASLNYRRLSFQDDTRDTESEIVLNFLVEF